jgi:hypothetical protein
MSITDNLENIEQRKTHSPAVLLFLAAAFRLPSDFGTVQGYVLQ